MIHSVEDSEYGWHCLVVNKMQAASLYIRSVCEVPKFCTTYVLYIKTIRLFPLDFYV